MSRRRPLQDHAVRPAATLREVRLNNFKSVRDASVELRPLTVIVGRNSSGKSTLLQGILALAQGVRGEVSSQKFPLNGDLVRLGTFDEVRNFDVDPGAGIDVGFTADLLRFSKRRPLQMGQKSAWATVSWSAHLAAAPSDSGSGQALLETMEFTVTKDDNGRPAPIVSLTVDEFRGDASGLVIEDRTYRRIGWLDEMPELEIDGHLTDLRQERSASVDLMMLSGGLPVQVFRTEEKFNVRFELWWDFACSFVEADLQEFLKAEHQKEENRRRNATDQVVEESSRSASKERQNGRVWALKFAKECMVSGEADGEEFPIPLHLSGAQVRRMGDNNDLAIFQTQFKRLRKASHRKLARAMVDLGEFEFREKLRSSLEKGNADWLDQKVRDEPMSTRYSDGQTAEEVHLDASQILEQATFFTRELFRRVRYLGPLRAKPQVMYSPGAGQVDLGPDGEFVAAYLHANALRQVLVPLPSGGAQVMALGEGLNLWLEELGLAGGAEATDRGRLGIGLYVQPVGRSQSVDLTSVGVGVSQALPVVLLCLLATPGSVILLEQPELHLHPAMQLKLADFLLAAARTGRQIVVETHSEHVVNRLRLHVAADETTETSEVIRLLFAEQESGETVYRISDISEVGGLSTDWPKGFLDVAADESTRLLQQALAKKRALSEKSV